MPRNRGHKSYYSFTGGLNSETSPLVSAENTALTLSNFDLSVSGKISRRLGLDFEAGFNTVNSTLSADALSISSGAINSFIWKGVGGVGNKDFYVLQVGYRLMFFDLAEEVLSGTDGYLGGINLDTYLTGSIMNKRLQFASGKGALFVTSSVTEPLYIEYDASGASFADKFPVTQIAISIRDFDGVDDFLQVDERPTTLAPVHKYNLRNQGWPEIFACARDADGSDGVYRVDPINWTYSGSLVGGLNAYPSNADIVYLGKLGAATDADAVGAYHPFQLTKVVQGSTQAPRGRFILDAFNRDRGTASGLIGLPNETFSERPQAIAFYAGRVFYAGVPNSKLSGTIFYSQLLDDLSNAGKCYQDQDPTAEQLNDLLATDGGTIEIPALGEVYKLVPLGDRLVIFSNTGVWSIQGGTDTGFTPTNHFSNFITNRGSLSSGSVVSLNNQIAYWAVDGIYIIGADETGSGLISQNISEATVQTKYSSIGFLSKLTAISHFDEATNKIFWCYKGTVTDQSKGYELDTFLVYDIKLQAFYDYTIPEATLESGSTSGKGVPHIIALCNKPSLSLSSDNLNIVVGSDDVVLGSDAVTLAVDSLVELGETSIKPVAMWEHLLPSTATNSVDFTFAEFRDTNFVDWATAIDESTILNPAGGVLYTSEVKTGYEPLDDASRDKQIRHIMWHFERTENAYELTDGVVTFDLPSSANVQIQWDWTETSTANRWTDPREAYILRELNLSGVSGDLDYSYSVISHKQRVRGRGQSLAFRIYSSDNKDLRLLGWDVEYLARSRM